MTSDATTARLFLETARDLLTYTLGFLLGWFLRKNALRPGGGAASPVPPPKNDPGTGSVIIPKKDKTDDILSRLNGK